jgi:hypothetical protein
MHASEELTDESLAISSDRDNIESCDPESTVFEKDNYEITELPKCNTSSTEFEDDVPIPYITLAPDSTVAALNSLGLRLEGVDHVKWRRDAAVHPRNWSTARKTFDTSLILLLDLFTCVLRFITRFWGGADMRDIELQSARQEYVESASRFRIIRIMNE